MDTTARQRKRQSPTNEQHSIDTFEYRLQRIEKDLDDIKETIKTQHETYRLDTIKITGELQRINSSITTQITTMTQRQVWTEEAVLNLKKDFTKYNDKIEVFENKYELEIQNIKAQLIKVFTIGTVLFTVFSSIIVPLINKYLL